MTAPESSKDTAVARADRRLIERMAAGDEAAMAELYDRYSERAYRVAHAVCRGNGLTEDAVQEAFLSVWRTSESYRPALGTVATWLLVTVRRRAIDRSRRDLKHTDHQAHPDLLDTARDPGDVAADALANVDAVRLRAQLAQLPMRQQEVIVLAFYGQLSHSEIADHLELPPGTVKGRMRLGLQKLRTEIARSAA